MTVMPEIQQWATALQAQYGITIEPAFAVKAAAEVAALSDELLLDVIQYPHDDSNLRKQRTLLRLHLDNWVREEQSDPVNPVPSGRDSYAVNVDPTSTEDIAERGFSPQVQSARGMRKVGDIKTLEDWVLELKGWKSTSCKQTDNDPICVDLSNCYLIDSDAPAVKEIVDQLVRLLPGRVFRVNLEHNYFHGYYKRSRIHVDDMVTRLLENSAVELLSLRRNPFASIDRQDFFQHLSTVQLKKLVWLPHSASPIDHRWQDLIVTDEYQEAEKQARIAAVAANILVSF